MIPKIVLAPNARTLLYVVMDGTGTLLAAAEAGCLAAGKHPVALTVALAVYGVLSARVHALARRNVTPPVG